MKEYQVSTCSFIISFFFQILLEGMDHLYLGIAAAGFVGLLAYFVLKRTCTRPMKAPEDSPVTSMAPERKSSTTPTSQKPPIMAKEPQQKPEPVEPKQSLKIKKTEDLQTEYKDTYFGSFRLKSANSMHLITALDFKGSKLLLATTKNQLHLFNLKTWKKDSKHSAPQKYFVSLDNNGASAVCIGENYYYAALTFDKTIVYYEFKGESGVYFKEVCKFQRNILKSNASAIHVSKSQSYIVTAGSGPDTVVDVWSMKGEKLASANTFQIEQYSTCCGLKSILVRGWTSEVKIFTTVEEKDGSFKKLQKFQHLAQEQSPLQSSICNRDMYAVSISKHHKVKIYSLIDSAFHRQEESSDSNPDLTSNTITKCALYTFEPLVGHFKTLVILTHSTGFVVCDAHLRTISKVEGIQVKDIYVNGTQKSVILGVVSPQAQISLWNLTKMLDNVEEVKL